MDLKFPRVIEEGRSPTVNDDESQGIIIGQPWVDVNTNDYYICTDILAGSANWDKIASMADLEAIIDNAPAVLDTLSELSTALQDNPAIITDLQASLASMLADLTALQGQVSGPPTPHTHLAVDITDLNNTGGGGGLGVGTVVNVSTDHNAAAGEFIAVDAIVPINITLPASPSIGDVLIVNDAEGKSNVNDITVLRNGNLIQNLDDDFILNIRNGQITFTYDSTGWLVDLGGAVISGSGDPRLLYPWKVVNSNYDAHTLDRLIADTSLATFTINLPIDPKQGQQVEISPGSDWANNNLIINSPDPIVGLNEPLELDTPRSIVLIYTATNYGWTVANYSNSSLIGVIGEGIIPPVITSPRDISNERSIIVDTIGGPFSLNLPASPKLGQKIEILNGGGWVTNNLTINPNGNKIMSQTGNLVADSELSVVLTYYNDIRGWIVSQ